MEGGSERGGWGDEQGGGWTKVNMVVVSRVGWK